MSHLTLTSSQDVDAGSIDTSGWLILGPLGTLYLVNMLLSVTGPTIVAEIERVSGIDQPDSFSCPANAWTNLAADPIPDIAAFPISSV